MYRVLLFAFLLVTLPTVAQDLQLVIPLGHTKRINDLAISDSKTWVASSDNTNRVILWDAKKRMEIYHLEGHQSGVSAIEFSGEVLLTGSSDKTVKFWSTDGINIGSLDVEGTVEDIIAISPAIAIAAIAPAKLLKIDVVDMRIESTSNSSIDRIRSLGINGNKDLFLAGNDQGEVESFSVESLDSNGKTKINEKRIGVVSGFSGGFIIGTDDGSVVQLDEQLQRLNEVKPFEFRTYGLAISEKSKQVYVAGRGTDSNLKVLKLDDLEEISQDLPKFQDPDGQQFAFGLRKLLWTVRDSILLIPDYSQNICSWNINTKSLDGPSFQGNAKPIFDIDLNTNQDRLAIASGHNEINVIDLSGVRPDIKIPTQKAIRSIDFHPVEMSVATYSLDHKIDIWDLASKKSEVSLKAKSEYASTPLRFDPSGKYLIRKNSEKDFDLYNFKKAKPKNLSVKGGRRFKFSKDGLQLYFLKRDGLSMHDPRSLTELKSIAVDGIQDFDVNHNGVLVLLKDDRTLRRYDTNLNLVTEFLLNDQQVDRVRLLPESTEFVGYKTTTAKGQSVPDYHLYVFDEDGSTLKVIDGHKAFINDLIYHNKSNTLISSSIDGMINFWKLDDQEPLKASYIQYSGGEYVVTSPKGLYDATPLAMNGLHYTKNGDVLSLDQLKSFYEPNLLPKILGYVDEPVRKVSNLNELRLFPELELDHPLYNDGKLGVKLNDQGGGIGRIMIVINGKEVSSDARDVVGITDQNNVAFDYDISGHPFLLDNKVNKITVKAFNRDGSISSQEKNIYLFGETNASKEASKPRLFAMIAGTSDYSGDQLDLKYAAKDAKDFANALEISASSFLGEEQINIQLLTTDQENKTNWPTKENIRRVFASFSSQAKAKDMLVVYLSGHGVNYGGSEGDFYYLTTLANNGDLDNPDVREKVGISSTEFTELIKSVPALKQVMVIDACHSGRLATDLVQSRSTMSSTQIRALERIKDRTGLFVLAGSAADAVSYETTLYDQGLLTYSLLFGMKGAALRDSEFVDVMELFQFAANKVPELAEDIGGIQKPQIRLPIDASSFDIGQMTSEHRDRIAIKAPKPVFINTSFQDQSEINDPLGLEELTNQKLLEYSKEKGAKIVYVDQNKFNSSIKIIGRYEEKNDLLSVKIKVVQETQILDQISFQSVNAELLSDQILAYVRANY